MWKNESNSRSCTLWLVLHQYHANRTGYIIISCVSQEKKNIKRTLHNYFDLEPLQILACPDAKNHGGITPAFYQLRYYCKLFFWLWSCWFGKSVPIFSHLVSIESACLNQLMLYGKIMIIMFWSLLIFEIHKGQPGNKLSRGQGLSQPFLFSTPRKMLLPPHKENPPKQHTTSDLFVISQLSKRLIPSMKKVSVIK